jgi:hypothetical protein
LKYYYILNEQFQSVFTTESIDNIPNKGLSPHPVIPSLTITTPGIQKLLNNISPHKATGPDNIIGRILKDLQNLTAPMLEGLELFFLYRCCKHVSVLSGPDVSTVCISLYIFCPFSF